ncbi:MAG TPA: NlpC/P60 family protein [Streptosporangiaceae bacterium]|nr:NlpC/P60 family protein [Streptosporangiaceae bacterium]
MSTVTAGLGATALLLVTGGMAVASPQVTIAQVQKQLNKLTTRQDKLDQQLDQVKQNLASATQRLAVVKREEARQSRQFNSMRGEIGQIAAQAYEQGSLNSSIALLTSGRPQQILDQSSMLLELSSANTAKTNQFLAAARALKNTQQEATRTRDGILQLKKSIASRLKVLNATVAKEKALLAQLTPVQVKKVTAPGGGGGTGGGGGGGGGGGQKPPPVSGAAGKAVDYAYAQLGCPYVYGATGPCNSGFDCSGLMMEAWAAAGVSIPRTSYEDWDQLPHVSESDMQPGDILVFDGEGHVGMYVGGGELIDAPQTGMNVEKVPLAGWYSANLDGVVRP